METIPGCSDGSETMDGITGNTPFPNGTRISGTYFIVCEINQFRYIGSSLHVYQRWQQHRKSLRKGTHPVEELQRDWNLYGEERFQFVLMPLIADREELFQKEQALIDHYGSLKLTYNILQYAKLKGSHPAESSLRKMRNWVPTDLTRRRMSEAKQGIPTTASTSAEARKKISESRQGIKHPLAKFTEADIILIRQRLAEGESGRSIARAYKVSPATINDIKLRKTWGHLA